MKDDLSIGILDSMEEQPAISKSALSGLLAGNSSTTLEENTMIKTQEFNFTPVNRGDNVTIHEGGMKKNGT